MEVSQQNIEVVGTDQAKKRLTKGKMLRVRLDPIDIYELNEVQRSVNLDMSATIRLLIKSFKSIQNSRDIVTAYQAMRKAEKEFEAAIT